MYDEDGADLKGVMREVELLIARVNRMDEQLDLLMESSAKIIKELGLVK